MATAARILPDLLSPTLRAFLKQYGVRVAARESAALLATLDPRTRIQMTRDGVPAATIDALARALGLSQEKLLDGLGLARATVDRRVRTGEPLTPGESERVLGLLRLVGDATRMMEESGNPDAADFDVGRWLGTWLETPAPALGGERPLALLDTADGRTLVGQILQSQQSGAYW